MTKNQVPLTVDKSKIKEYKNNYKLVSKNTNNLFLFAGDQKIEHLNDDFVGKGISKEDQNPEHLFKIASQADIGVFASQLGLISRYGRKYKNIPYLVKLNSKTNLYKDKNPHSQAINDVKQVIEFKKNSKLKIVAVGYTIYLGSKYEKEMLTEASNIIYEAHKEGLLAIIWMYPRGENIKNETDIHLLAGAAGVANSLGADFVKIKYPDNKKTKNISEKYKEVIDAGGNTGVICVGGSQKTVNNYLDLVNTQIHEAGASGIAVGRNIHQRSLKDAIKLSQALSAIIYKKASLASAKKIYKSK